MIRRERAAWRGLLVSVRDADEARAALVGGAALIDVKEPARGPLGAADALVVAAIVAEVGGRVPWTIACGELAEPECVAAARRAWPSLAGGVPAGAKAGPAGLGLAAWRREFAAFAAAVPPGCAAVAVAYADAAAAAAPEPVAIIAAAAAMGCTVVLVDTFDKVAPGLLATARGRELAAKCVAAAHGAGMCVALAGRLSIGQIPAAMALGADVVAVRSAVCGGDRFAPVCRRLVRAAKLGASREPADDERPTAISEGRA
jgi:uncharacterized protein (UPF0264 family)